MIALPPAARGHTALRMTAAAARGRFELQVCESCGTTQYPPREVCGRCLSGSLRWRVRSGRGTLLAMTMLRHSNEEYFRSRLPWRTGLVSLAEGPTVIAHLHQALPPPPCDVRVIARLDRSGQGVLIAVPMDPDSIGEDSMMQEMGCDPKSRSVLITDGDSALGRSLAQALTAAGAARVWTGLPEGPAGAEIDIVINTRQRLPTATPDAAAEMQAHYFDLMTLVDRCAPVLESRAAQGRVCAWVNLLSLDALTSVPARGSYSASMAAAHSYTQHLRHRLQVGGIRVIAVYPDPDIAADALAGDIVTALREGIEDVFAGPVAQSWAHGMRESPKVLEREVALAARRSP